MLKDIKSMNQNIFLTVDTTCPLARCETPTTPKTPGFEPPPTIVEDEVRIENESKSIERHHRGERDHHHRDKSRHSRHR